MPVTINLGNGDFAELEPEHYEIDRQFVDDLWGPGGAPRFDGARLYQQGYGEERPCGCPGDPSDPHLADCSGTRAPTKQDYLDAYGHLDVDDWPDEEG